MGQLLPSQKEAKIGIFGYNGAGKTSLLYRMVLGKAIQVIPTIGFNVDTFSLNGVKFTAWDVGGRGKIRALHHHYYAGLNAVVYIVDAVDTEIMPEAIDEFQRMTKEPQLQNCIFMLLGNKQDLPNALSMQEIERRFDVKSVNQTVYVQGVCVTSSDGVHEAFHWLSEQLKQGTQSRWAAMKDNLVKYTPFMQCTAPHEQIVE
jgi:small GTP-binding protein